MKEKKNYNPLYKDFVHIFLDIFIYIFIYISMKKRIVIKNKEEPPVFDQNEKGTLILTEIFMKKEADSI